MSNSTIVVLVGVALTVIGLLMMLWGRFGHRTESRALATNGGGGFWGFVQHVFDKLLPFVPKYARFGFVIFIGGIAVMLSALFISSGGSSSPGQNSSTSTQTSTTP